MGLALGACASAGHVRPATQANPGIDGYDAEKVAAVNIWAETKGAKVIWINFPTKPRARDGG
jgi:hypothetical protein